MTTTHPQADLFAGDEWEIRATLLDENDIPYDLTGSPTIEWTLLDHNGKRAINGTGVNITITDALAGKCTILVTKVATKQVVISGMYNDALRLTIGGISSTLLVGPIHVTADPWKVP